jgi:hypothetical protein
LFLFHFSSQLSQRHADIKDEISPSPPSAALTSSIILWAFYLDCIDSKSSFVFDRLERETNPHSFFQGDLDILYYQLAFSIN